MSYIVNEQEYSVRMTGNQFLYNEFKVMCKLIAKGYSRKDASDKIINENLFEHKTIRAVGKHIGAVWERANYLDEHLREVVLTQLNEVGRIVNFYSILKYDLLFLEFMEEIIADKFCTYQLELSKADISKFFSIKAEQSEIVANFKDSTMQRLRLAYIQILEGAGYMIKKNDKMELTIPIAAYQISNYLENIGEKRYARAVVGK